jgi:hypothetical protein
MSCKNCGRALVWLAGALLALALLFPNGLPSVQKPVAPVTPSAPVVTDAKIVELLKDAAPEDRARIYGIYTGLKTVIARDNGQLVSTTDKWATLQANTLKLAVDKAGVYPGLDTAIEAVFLAAVGTDDVVSVTADVVAKLQTACDTIANSAAGK